MYQHTSQHRFSSLQRPTKHPRDPNSSQSHGTNGNVPTTSNNINSGAGGPTSVHTINRPAMGHYGTTPRPHKTWRAGSATFASHGHTSRGLGNETGSFYRLHERAERERIAYHHEPLTPKSSNHSTMTQPSNTSSSTTTLTAQKRERRNSRMTNEQFRTTMELLVSQKDPRSDLVDFHKIGEGSTGIVYTAKQMSTGRVVAVKKMHLWKQQRRELLFNEVSINVSHCSM